jgi:hypothetical protein
MGKAESRSGLAARIPAAPKKVVSQRRRDCGMTPPSMQDAHWQGGIPESMVHA